jgi:hypothetical protein
MVDLKLPKEKLEKTSPAVASFEQDQYPYETRITIGNKIYDKFEGLDELDTGSYVKIIAYGSVVSKRSNKVKGGKQDNSTEFQLEKMDISESKTLEKMSTDEFMKSRNKKS